jgi:hypothetical protein
MKNNSIVMAIVLLIFCPLFVAGQETASTSVGISSVPFTVSIETGRLDPEPGCKKDSDGCLPKVWVSTGEYQSGSRVWLKITLVNRTDMTAIRQLHAGELLFWANVIEKKTGSNPSLTHDGCRLRPSLCNLPDYDPTKEQSKYSGSGWRWMIPPGVADSRIMEVTRLYDLTNPGEYNISAEITGFYFTAKENIANSFFVKFIDKTAVKQGNEVNSDSIQFVIVK